MTDQKVQELLNLSCLLSHHQKRLLVMIERQSGKVVIPFMAVEKIAEYKVLENLRNNHLITSSYPKSLRTQLVALNGETFTEFFTKDYEVLDITDLGKELIQYWRCNGIECGP